MLDVPSSVQVGSVRGIPIRLHLTFLLLLPFFAYLMAEGYFSRDGQPLDAVALAWGAALAVVLFVCVTLHELSHSLTAQRFGIRVRSITLLPIGGVSQMEEMPKEPGREFLVSVAGPLTNFVIGIPLLLWGRTVGVPEILPRFDVFVNAVALVNLGLGVFNLFVPAFPMDGGRILRSLLARRMPFTKATKMAAGVGRAIALGMALLGILTFPNGLLLILIAVFIYTGAGEEARSVEVQDTLGNLRVRDVMTASPVILRSDDTLDQAVQLMLRTKHAGFPVVDDTGRVVGFLGLPELAKVAREHYPYTAVRLLMRLNVPFIDPGVAATEALRVMSTTQEEHLVVLEQGRLAGIVTRTDLTRVVSILGVLRGQA